jgi:hypothetical protein
MDADHLLSHHIDLTLSRSAITETITFDFIVGMIDAVGRHLLARCSTCFIFYSPLSLSSALQLTE